MAEMIYSLPFIIAALLSVTLIDTLGAIASRKFDFNYGYLALISFAIYMLIGYYIAGVAGLNMVLLASFLVGFYDATVGFKLSRMCKANFVFPKEQLEKMTYSYTLRMMMLICPTFSFIGYIFRKSILQVI